MHPKATPFQMGFLDRASIRLAQGVGSERDSVPFPQRRLCLEDSLVSVAAMGPAARFLGTRALPRLLSVLPVLPLVFGAGL